MMIDAVGQGGGDGCGKRWLKSRYTLKIEPGGLVNGLGVVVMG